MTSISAAAPSAPSAPSAPTAPSAASPGTSAAPSLPSPSAGPQPPSAPAAPASGRAGPLRNGNPRGDPNLAPRCGARARSGLACRGPAMANGRCKNHGGKCTGPRTAEGLARLAAARTKHGDYGAAWRAVNRYQRTAIVRSRLFAEAYDLKAYLPPEIAARVDAGGPDIPPPRHYSNAAVAPGVGEVPPASGTAGRDARGRFAARPAPALRGQRLEREAARREVALLAPWRAGIAAARLAKRAARRAQLAVRRAAGGRDTGQPLAAGGRDTGQPLAARACPDGGTVRAGGVHAGAGPASGGVREGAAGGQAARTGERRQDCMIRATVPPGEAAAGAGSEAGPRQGEALGRGAMIRARCRRARRCQRCSMVLARVRRLGEVRSPRNAGRIA